jgi:peptide-methionine (R)-S-oxide reductase
MNTPQKPAEENLIKYHKKSDAAIGALTPEKFHVTQQSGTEKPGTAEHLNNNEPGFYVDVVSGEPLLASSAEFDSGFGRRQRSRWFALLHQLS